MSRLLVALVLVSFLSADASAQCGARRTPVRTLLSHLRPANHPHLFPRLAAHPVLPTSGVVVGGCASGACTNGVCPAPAIAPKVVHKK